MHHGQGRGETKYTQSRPMKKTGGICKSRGKEKFPEIAGNELKQRK